MPDQKNLTESQTVTEAGKLVAFLKQFDSVAVAFSAGVDSAVVAKAAYLALGEKAIALTGVGPALAEGELEEAKRIAQLIGIQHVEVVTDEINNPLYIANNTDRCYHCKTELYEQAKNEAQRLGISHLMNGANADDQSDYRPGMMAATEHQVRSPLLELGINKAMVRSLAKHWSLPIWDKPASPCLASRLAYGQEVSPERLAMIDAAERWIKSVQHEGNSPREVRVRYHEGDKASVELPKDWVKVFQREPLCGDLKKELLGLGFQHVEIDQQGFRSGSLNEIILPQLPS